MNNKKSICQIHKEIEKEVIDFNAHVVSAGEESITDYLMWRWSLANKELSHFSAKTFTRPEENTKSGADIELELWIIGNKYSLPLVIQSKKLSREHNKYRAALSYPKDTKNQITKLLDYANKGNKVPLYMFYSQSSEAPYWKTTDCGIFIAHADDMLSFAGLPKATSLSKIEILNKCIRFHDLFCVDKSNNSQTDLISNIIDKLARLNIEKDRSIDRYLTDSLPNYVRYILDHPLIEKYPEIKSPQEVEEIKSIIKRQYLKYFFINGSESDELKVLRNIAVYDARTKLTDQP